MVEHGDERGDERGAPPLRWGGIRALVLVFAACSSPEQVYEGGERPDHEVAVIRVVDETPRDSVLAQMLVGGVITAVNGHGVDAVEVEVLPGPYDVCVIFAVEGMPSAEGRLGVEAVAGREYVVDLTLDERGPVLRLSDAETREVLDDTRRTPEELSPVDLGLSGEGWHVAHSANSCRDRGLTWLPEGEAFDDWTEQVNAYVRFFPDGVTPVLDEVLADRRRQVEAGGVTITAWNVLSRDDVSATYHYLGRARRHGREQTREGLGRLVVKHRERLHCGYEADSALDPAAREDWRARLEALAWGPSD